MIQYNTYILYTYYNVPWTAGLPRYLGKVQSYISYNYYKGRSFIHNTMPQT